MYLQFFGFARTPFERDLPPDQLFRAPALDELHTRLCHLADTPGIGLLYLHDTSVNAGDLCRGLAAELGIEPRWGRAMTFRAIQQELVRLTTERRLTVLLVLDEAHYLRPDVLAELPLFTNFDWDSGARLSLLLCGQVGLRQRLRRAALEALTQRNTVRYAMRGVDRDTTRLYVGHRLRVAGVDRPVVSEPAVEALFKASQGVFRKIDSLATLALTAAAAARARIVDADHVVLDAEELRA